MGVVKSAAHSYTYNEYLYYYINKKDTAKVEEILNLKPNLIKDPLTLHSKTTALNRACYNGNIQLVKLLVEKYKADINLPSPKGLTPLISALQRNHIKLVKVLLEMGADPNYEDANGLRTIDYAILQGLYQISQMIFCQLKDKQLKTPEEYKEIGKNFQYRYVDYEKFIQELKHMVEPENVSDFLEKKRNLLSDPVIDPRQSWNEWFFRNLDFKDPPLVQRNELPEQMRPQNRKFGKVQHFFGKLAMSPASQVPSYKKSAQSEMGNETKNNLAKMKSENIQMHSVS